MKQLKTLIIGSGDHGNTNVGFSEILSDDINIKY
jgi:hypothetical protein